MPRPLFITGASRSGTSMTAGLFYHHSLWFGPCMEASEINPKGFFESEFTKQNSAGYHTPRGVTGWEQWLADHDAPEQWAVKAGPEWWPLFREFNPVVVCCYRDRKKIVASRKKAGFSMHPDSVTTAWHRMSKIPDSIDIHPDKFVSGEFSEVMPVFDALGVAFNEDTAKAWVDPGLWSG